MSAMDPRSRDLNVFRRFPDSGGDDDRWDRRNPAIQLYGRRFYKDQTPLEYLAEFLLVFASPKDEAGGGAYRLKLSDDPRRKHAYYPKERIGLKLFAFFASSKLETRHPVHRRGYLDALDALKLIVRGSIENRDEAVRLIQSVLAGFAGISKNRTWVTHTFLPAATALLAREVTWKHPAALKGNEGQVTDWISSKHYFDSNTRNFFGRGGELLFLQLANLFSDPAAPEIASLVGQDFYRHLANRSLPDLRRRLESSLRYILEDAVSQLDGLVKLVEGVLNQFDFEPEGKATELAWVPRSTRIEALLFAAEIDNICASPMGSLEKVELLQTLFCLHVMRSLCFQAARVDAQLPATPGFCGNYAWVACDAEAPSTDNARNMAEASYSTIESLLFRAIRSPALKAGGAAFSKKELDNGDDNAFRHFRKFGKDSGLVIPPNGRGQRFSLHVGLLRFLVAALVAPGERIRLDDFYARVFAHYGIALGGEPLATAIAWSGGGTGERIYGVNVSTAWAEEALQQGGFLIELSDAVSIVHNPGGGEART